MAIHQMLKCDLIPLDQINQFTWSDSNTNENNRLLAGNNSGTCGLEVRKPQNDPYITSNGYYGYSPISVHLPVDNSMGDCEMETTSTGMENDYGTHPNSGAGMVLVNNSDQQCNEMNSLGADAHSWTQHLGRRKRNYNGDASYPIKKIRADECVPSPIVEQQQHTYTGAGSACLPSEGYPRCMMGHYI